MHFVRWSVPQKLRRPLVVLAFVATAAWFVQLFVLPWIVAKVVANSLKSVGLDAARFNVRYVSIFRTDVDNIVLAQQTGLHIAQVSATYQPFTLLRGRVQTIELTGLQLRASMNGSGVDLGPIGAFRSNGSRAGGDFPFHELIIRASSLQLALSDRQISVPIDGTIVCTPARPATIDVNANLLNSPVHIHGTVDTTSQHTDLSGDVQGIDVSSLQAIVKPYLSASLRCGGILSAKIEFIRAPVGLSLKVWSRLQDGWLRAKAGEHLILLDKIALTADAASNDKLELNDGHITLTGETARFDDLSSAIQLSATLHHDSGDIGWTLSNPAWHATVADGKVSWQLTPTAADLGFGFTWSAAGQLGAIASAPALRLGLNIDQLGALTVNGKTQGTVHQNRQSGATLWQVKASDNHLDLQPGDIRLINAAINLPGVRASANFNIESNNDRIDLRVLPGTRLSIEDVQTPWITPRREAKTRPRPPLLELLIDKSASFAAQSGRSPTPWTATCESVRLKLNPCLLPLDRFNAALTGVQGELAIAGDASPTAITARIADSSWLGFESVSLPRGTHPITTTAFLANFVKTPQPAISYSFADASLSAKLNLRARQDQSFDIEVGPHYAKLNDLAVAATITRQASTPPSIQAELSCNHSTAWIDTPGIGIFDFSARIPISQNSPHDDAGSIAAKATSVFNDAWPGLSGAARFADGKFDLNLAWPLLKEAILQIKANVDTTPPDGTRADVSASIPKFTLTDPSALGGLLHSSKDIQLTGTFALDSHVQLNRGVLTPKIQLTISDADFASAAYSASINGFSTDLTLNSFTPLSTPGNQQIKITSANLGNLELSDGLIAFRIESPTSILIEETHWGWAGGHLYSHAVRFDPAKPNFDFVAFGDGLRVKDVLKLAAGPTADGDGTVYGRLPVSVRWPAIAFHNGYLYAAPGGGRIQLAQHADDVAKLLEQDPRFAKGAKSSFVKRRVVDSLKNFSYDLLKLDFVQEDNKLKLVTKIHGTGKIGQDNQELTLDLSFGGFDQLLQHWLVIRNMVSR